MKKIKKLSKLVEKVSKNALKEHPLLFKEIAIKWNIIVGQTISNRTIPSKITYNKFSKENVPGNLVIRTDPSFALELQHLQDKLLERINTFLGYKAIGSISLIQSPIFHKREKKSLEKREKYSINDQFLIKKTKNLKSSELSEALRKLGSAALTKNDEK